MEKGYGPDDARARICQDIILKAISESSLSRNVTIKGGVVMRSMTDNIRRATQDMDIDFIRYSLSDDSIEQFIKKLNVLDGISIVRIGRIEELNQQDYKGKRVYVRISDKSGNQIESKIDFGVHKHMSIEQEEYCFDIGFDDEGASLLINSKEQMFTEKIRSLLKFGFFSTRYKDIYDMYYQCGKMDRTRLLQCFRIYIFDDPQMKENNIGAIISREKSVFQNDAYKKRVDESDKRWMDESIEDVFAGILSYLKELE